MLAVAQRTANSQFKASRMTRANDDNTHKKPKEKTAVLGYIPVLLKPEVDQLKSGYRRPCPPLQEPLICHHGGHKGAHSERQPSCVSGRLIYDTPLCLAPLKTPQIQRVWFSETQQGVKKERVWIRIWTYRGDKSLPSQRCDCSMQVRTAEGEQATRGASLQPAHHLCRGPAPNALHPRENPPKN